MAKSILLLIFLFFGLVSLTLGQQKEELIRIKCDTTIWSVTNFPPKLNMTNEELNAMINQQLHFDSRLNDSIAFIYICAVISCDGNADYKCFYRNEDSANREICEKVIDILKSNCKWTPGKLKKDSYENVRVKKGNKYVNEKRRVIENVYYNYSMQFKFKDGTITRISK